MSPRASKAAAAMAQSILRAEAKRVLSPYEEKYHAFSPQLIEVASAAGVSVAPQLEHLNKIGVLCAGMGVVARIIAGSCVVADAVDADDPTCMRPLSNAAIGHLECMLAELCEQISNGISGAADRLSNEVKA